MSLNAISVKVSSTKDFTVKRPNYGVTLIKKLADVYAYSPVNGDTLVFDAITGKYVSKQLTSSEINITNIDAGTF